MMSQQLGVTPPLWAEGFLAQSVGKVQVEYVKRYIDSQPEHHEYHRRPSPPVFRYRAEDLTPLSGAHSRFDLSHHIVLATRYRRGVFGSVEGRQLITYWQVVARKKHFALDRASVLPDHVHLLVRLTPKMSVHDCVISLMNNAQYWFAKNSPQLFIKCELDQLWQPSAYAGTSGEISTARMKSFLSVDLT